MKVMLSILYQKNVHKVHLVSMIMRIMIIGTIPIVEKVIMVPAFVNLMGTFFYHSHYYPDFNHILALFNHIPRTTTWTKSTLFLLTFCVLLCSQHCALSSVCNESCSKLNYLIALKIVAHFTGWGAFWTFSWFLGILGTPRDHPGGCGSVSRDMGGRETKRCFSDFGLYLQVHRGFWRAISVKSFVFKCSKCSQ